MPTHFNVDIYLNVWLEYIILSMNMWWHLCKIFVNVTCSIILLSWKCLNYIHDKAQVFQFMYSHVLQKCYVKVIYAFILKFVYMYKIKM